MFLLPIGQNLLDSTGPNKNLCTYFQTQAKQNYGVKDEDFYQDVTVTNTNGQYQVIQTKYDQIDPSFTVNANYGQRTPPAYIDTTVAIGNGPKKYPGTLFFTFILVQDNE